MPMEGTATGKNVYGQVKKVVQGLDSPVGGNWLHQQETVTLHSFVLVSINVKKRRSRFGNMPLFDTPRKSACEMSQSD
jgi:hypothetical protein